MYGVGMGWYALLEERHKELILELRRVRDGARSSVRVILPELPENYKNALLLLIATRFFGDFDKILRDYG